MDAEEPAALFVLPRLTFETESSGVISSSPSKIGLPESDSPPKRRGTRGGGDGDCMRRRPRPRRRPARSAPRPRAIVCSRRLAN
eukprot:scaffold6811_cov126-Isochrysis_galbana.AAC.4